jgi:putative methyltransferase (TIGR04325 family)
MSGVLQYLPDPYDLLSKLTALKINTLIIDRTCYSNSSQEKYIRIQHVPETIYKASYPCHFFSENNLTNFILAQGYKLFEEFSSLDNLDSEAYWKGHIYIIQ